MAEVGLHPTGVTTRVISDEAEAADIGFTGSPTIRIDGYDWFAPSVSAEPSLSCRT